MLVKVYQPMNQPVRIVYPNPKYRLPEETDEEFMARVAAHTEALNPSLNNLPSVTMEAEDLPDTRRREEVGEVKGGDTRAGWRLEDGEVVVSEADVKIDPEKRGS